MRDPKCMLEGWTGAVVSLVPERAEGTGQESEMKLAFYAGGEFVYLETLKIWKKYTEDEEMTAKDVVSAMMEIQAEIERYDALPVGPCQMTGCTNNVESVCQKRGVIQGIVERCKWNISTESSGSS